MEFGRLGGFGGPVGLGGVVSFGVLAGFGALVYLVDAWAVGLGAGGRLGNLVRDANGWFLGRYPGRSEGGAGAGKRVFLDEDRAATLGVKGGGVRRFPGGLTTRRARFVVSGGLEDFLFVLGKFRIDSTCATLFMSAVFFGVGTSLAGATYPQH